MTAIQPEQVTAAVLIDGEPWAPTPPAPCRHINFGVSHEIHNLVADPSDPASPRVAIRVAIEVLCLDCGAPCRFVPGTWQVKDDRSKAGVHIEVCEPTGL